MREIFNKDNLTTTNRLSITKWDTFYKKYGSEAELYSTIKSILSYDVTKDLPDGWQNLVSNNQIENWIIERKNDSHFYALQLTSSSELIGFLFLYDEECKNENLELRLGYLIKKEFWGRGLGSEMIKGLVDWCENIDYVVSLSGGVSAENLGSIRVLEKNGFKRIESESENNMLFFVKRFNT